MHKLNLMGGMKWWIVLPMLLAMLAIAAIGCSKANVAGPAGPAGPTGPAGAAGPAGVSTGTISGKLTSSIGGGPVAGVTVTMNPVVTGVSIAVGANGAYSANLPIGTYTLTFAKSNFETQTATVSVVAGQTAAKDIVLKALKPVAVSAGAAQTAKPGATVTLKAAADIADGSTVTGYLWEQTGGVKATIDNPKAESVKVTLPNDAAFKAELIKRLKTEDRFQVQAINPHSLIDAEKVTMKLTVTTSSGSYSATVAVSGDTGYVFSTGLANVAKGVPVLMSGKNQGSYNWTITPPSGSKAAVDSASSKNPTFVPDVVGKYTLTEKTSGAVVEVYAGTWVGAISGQDAKGNPLSANCTVCHNGTIASNQFIDWAQSGHAEIFTQNINDPAGHWSESCAECHSVGYNPAVDNGGADDAIKAEGWKAPSHGEAGLWTKMLTSNPKTTKLMNIQCENCHGPNEGSGLHGNKVIDAARVSISSDLCGSCHGEPLRHGRFQQWEESGHGNFELAIDESGRASCARCHTGQGFMAWIAQDDMTLQLQGKNGNATAAEMAAIVTKDNAQPITCVVCHDPHKLGDTSGEPNNIVLRISGDTPMLPSGYQAKDVGNGAMCITCHNTRNGAHNDSVAITSYSAPHVAAQGDVLMGQNAYFVNVGARSPHASITNSCTNCHMEKTPPPAEFSYNGAGTNHEFGADISICGDCHTNNLNGKAFQQGYEDKIHELGNAMGAYLLKKIDGQVTVKEYTPHTYNGKEYDVKSNPIAIDKANIVSAEPTEPHGQQGFLFKLKTPVTFTYSPTGETPHTMTVSEIEVQLGDVLTADGKASLIATSDLLVKAGWNYFLAHGDASLGVHNPAFTMDILNGAIQALK